MFTRNWNIDKDYHTLKKWWKQHEFGVVPMEVLPPDGIIVEDVDGPICAGGLYIGTGTKFAFMEWIVGDKNSDKKKLHKALKLCIEAIMEMAQNKGMRLVYTVTGESALQKRYVKHHGMKLTENSVKTYLRDLTGNTYKNLDWISDDTQISKDQTNK
jgi:hypothetical protein